MQKESTLELYIQYKDVISEAINFNFDFGPYSEEKQIIDLCKIFNLPISQIQACKIGETIYFYKLQNAQFKKSLDKFKNLLV